MVYMTHIEKGEFDKRGLMKILLPYRFYQSNNINGDTFSMERVPISTQQGDFDAFLFAIYTTKTGDLAYQSIYKTARLLINELSKAEAKGADNTTLLQMCKNLLKTVSQPPSNSITFENALIGEVITEPVSGEIFVPISKPPGIDNKNVGGALQLRPMKAGSFDLGIITLCSHRSNTKNMITGLSKALSISGNQQGSILKQIKGDILKNRLALLF